MSTAFLIVAVFGVLVTLNALRPWPGSLVAVPSFFAGWLTTELAPHLLVLHAAGVAAFVASGAVQGWQGVAAMVLAGTTAAGLMALIVQSHSSRRVVERALCDGLGPDYLQQIIPPRSIDYDLRVPWRQLVLPFRMSHPSVVRIRNVQYGPHGRRNRLDVYRPKEVTPGAPVLLQIHGGGWAIGNKDQQGKPVMLHLASRGWVCFAPNYRLSPRATFPDHVIDVKRALAWVRGHAHEYGADPSFVVVTGGSAGGHLAALVSLTANDPEYQPGFEDADTSVQACVPYYGVYDFTNTSDTRAGRGLVRFLEHVVLKKRFSQDRHAFERASPLYRIRPDAPPFFVVHGRHDTLAPMPEARRFVARLRDLSGNPVVYAELPGAQHAFDVFPSIRTAHVIRAVERFADWVYSRHAEAREASAGRGAWGSAGSRSTEVPRGRRRTAPPPTPPGRARARGTP